MEIAAVKDHDHATTQPLHLPFDVFYRSTRDSVARALVLTLGNQELGVEAADEAMTRVETTAVRFPFGSNV